MVIKHKNYFIYGSLGLIILGIALVSLIDRLTSPTNGASDIRARAGVLSNLKFHAMVESTDPTGKTITVSDIYLTDDSRSGDAKNYGSWLVAIPSNFSFSQITPGNAVVIEIAAKSFLVQEHTMTALSIKPSK